MAKGLILERGVKLGHYPLLHLCLSAIEQYYRDISSIVVAHDGDWSASLIPRLDGRVSLVAKRAITGMAIDDPYKEQWSSN
jgi:hypothetical protein